MKEINVSVILTSYNSEKYINEAILSVKSQTLFPKEIILIDDGSTDNTVNIAKEHKEVKIYEQRNMGPSSARNKGLDIANGSHVAFLDADDYWEINKLELQVEFLKNNPDANIVAGKMQEFDNLNKETDEPKLCPLLSCILIEKEVFIKVGLFDEKLRVSEDSEWLLRVNKNDVKIHYIEQVIIKKRKHDKNLSSNTSSVHKELLSSLHKHMKVKR